jgi:ubiquinone biosynthesis monooxygenase Coq6
MVLHPYYRFNNYMMFRLLVGADGGNSTVRKLAGYPSWGWSYGQDALVATIKVDSATSTAWQTYLSTGPLAVLPLWDNYCSIVWSGPSSQTRWLQSLPDDEFLIELNKALEIPLKTSSFSDFIPKANDCDSPSSSSYREEFIKKGFQALRKPIEIFSSEVAAVLDTAVSAARLNTEPPSTPPRVVSIESKRLSFPLQLQQSSRYTSSRIALIGDSAHTIHPQAGQGLNMGLRDADDLATVILEGLSVGCDIGDSELLDRYGRRSFRRNLAMLGVVDTINSLFAYQNADGDDAKLREFLKTYSSPQGFANHQSIIASLRSVGMLGVQYLTPLKKRIASYAMGI